MTDTVLLSNIDAITLVFAHWFGYTISMLIICCELIDFKGDTALSYHNLYNTPYKLSGVIFISAAASAAGLPPFLGFWTKTAIFVKIAAVSSFTYVSISSLLVLYGLFFYLSYLRSCCSVDIVFASRMRPDAKTGVIVIIFTLINSIGFLFFDEILIFMGLLI